MKNKEKNQPDKKIKILFEKRDVPYDNGRNTNNNWT